MAISRAVPRPVALRAIGRRPAAAVNGDRIVPAGEPRLGAGRTDHVPAARAPTPLAAVSGIRKADRAVARIVDPTAVPIGATVVATVAVREATIAVREAASVDRIAEATAVRGVASAARTMAARAAHTIAAVTGVPAVVWIARAGDVRAMSASPASGSRALPETELAPGVPVASQVRAVQTAARDTVAATTSGEMDSGRNGPSPREATTGDSTVPPAIVRALVPGPQRRTVSTAQAPSAQAIPVETRVTSGRTGSGAPAATISCGRAMVGRHAETKMPATSLAGTTRTRGWRVSCSPSARGMTTRSSPRRCRRGTCRVRRGSS